MASLASPALSLASPAPGDRTPEEAFVELLADGLHRIHKVRHELRSITLEITKRCDLVCGPARAVASGAGIPRVVLKTAVHPGNLRELPVVLELTRRLRIAEWHLIPIEPIGRAASRPDLLLSRAEYSRLVDFCDGLRSSRSPTVVLGEEETEGDLRLRSLEEIWRTGFAKKRSSGFRACDHHRFEGPGS